MPKKISTNSKALEARERKAETKKSVTEKASRTADDLLWQDDDKNLAKKNAKKQEEERKKAELLRKKAENKALLEQEVAAIKTTAKQSIQKITQAQIQDEIEKRNKVIENVNAKPENIRVVKNVPLEENLNRAMADTVVAQTVEEAIAVLRVSGDDVDPDKHPEKRMKALYKSFEAANLPRIKAENPRMRLSQWKQLLFREWGKSPENPLNNRA